MTTTPEVPLPPPASVDDLLRPPPPVRLVPVPPAIAVPTSAVFGAFARLRGRRPMHPVGVVTNAHLTVPHDDHLPARWRALDEAEGVVRFSKSIGLPRGLPDVLGIAVRFGGQDLLLATVAGSRPLAQHVLVPATAFDTATFSTLLPHRVGASAAVIQARLAQRLPGAGDPLDAVRAAGPIAIELWGCGLFGGRRRLGTVVARHVLPDDPAGRVRFDPWRAGGGLRPMGPLQRVRAAAYAASRSATRR